MSRVFKYMVHLRSAPGLSLSFRSIITVRAETPEQAKDKAVEKVVSEHPKFKNRRKQAFWRFDSIQEIGNA